MIIKINKDKIKRYGNISTDGTSLQIGIGALKIKKSQEEMVGFVLIVILVTIIMLAFLWIMVKSPGKVYDDSEAESFLHASLLYTSDCRKSPEIAYNMKDLVKGCGKYEKCVDDRSTCEVLKETYKDLLAKSFPIESVVPGARYKGYKLSITSTGNSIDPNNFPILLPNGIDNTNGQRYSARVLIPGGNYRVTLDLYPS